MALVHYYLGRPASVWIAAMSKRSSARAQVVDAGDPPPGIGSGYGRRMEIAELAHLRRARDLLEREYARPLNVPAMARAALMSPSLFSRRFREAYGETPYAYLQARRVERAMGLLRDGGLSVTDVCMAVGFTSLGSFSSTFTRLVGEPPSAYKARDHARLAPVPPCMTRSWARPGWIAEPCRIGEALPAAPA
jgi:AraC-like DNA-binding protein